MVDEGRKPGEETGMVKLATFIVDKRNLVFLVTIIALIFSLISANWVEVENDLTVYLPGDSETRRGLDLMAEQFVTYGTAEVMVENLSISRASQLYEELVDITGVQSIVYVENEHYNNVSALYTITFDYSDTDQRCLDALDAVKEHLNTFDIYVSTALGNTKAELIDQEVSVIMVIVAIIVVTVLILTSQTYAEIPVMLLTFVLAMLLNNGSNFLLSKISFISNSVTSVLQLALSLDYAVILCNRFKEERETLPLREAVIMALSKGIPEIASSSLTTIGGMVAMMFMQFRIGMDMAICLIKAILYALLSVFVIMPGLLMLFGPWMDKTKHKNFIPDMIPWDYNLAFGTFQGNRAADAVNDDIDSPLSVTGNDRPMIDWIFRSEAYTELYHQYFREFLDTVDAAEIISQAKERIAPYVEKDPTKFCTYEEFEKGVEALTAFCDLRSQSVAQQLAGEEADVDAASLNLSDMGTMGKGFGGKDRQPGNQNTGNDTQTQKPSENTPGQMPGNQNPMGFPMPNGMEGRFPGQDGHREQANASASQEMAQWTLLIIAFAVMAAGLLFAYKFRR